MSKQKSISELVFDLQRENESLQNLKKLFNKACKDEFGFDVKELHQIIEKLNYYERKAEEM